MAKKRLGKCYFCGKHTVVGYVMNFRNEPGPIACRECAEELKERTVPNKQAVHSKKYGDILKMYANQIRDLQLLVGQDYGEADLEVQGGDKRASGIMGALDRLLNNLEKAVDELDIDIDLNSGETLICA